VTDLCPHGDVPAACLDCLTGRPPERPNREAAKPKAASHAFTARFPGQCAGCNLGIHEGQAVVKMSDESYRHARCAS
jgi:hypothetical protein